MSRLRGIDDLTDTEVIRIVREGDPRGGTALFSPEEKRANFRAVTSRSLTADVAGITEDQTTEGVPVRTYIPDVIRPGAGHVLFLHGGGFLSGDFDTHDPLCRLLANRVETPVTAVKYRLAPENPYPAAVEDSWSALRWLQKRDAGRIALVGDSAGGNLAAVLAILGRDKGSSLSAQVLIYPMLDAMMTSPSMVENALVPPFTLVDCLQAWQWYLGPVEAYRRSPDVSPLHLPDLRGLAPAMIVTAGFDILRDDGVRYAQRLRESGVAVQHAHFPDMVHGFFQWTAQVGASRACLDKVVAFLRSE